jgi:S-adenosylmethionine-diacylgycerolhomoserine-N-methlytransferase
VEFFGGRIDDLALISLVDLCPALLEQARLRWRSRRNVIVIHADATQWQPPVEVDCVYMSYALTMIPDWQAAIDNALAMLRPGGVLGVVDFYVSAAQPAAGLVCHSALTRRLWPRWFLHDGVRLDPAHLSYLMSHCETVRLCERSAPLPYVPGVRVPHYLYVGRKAGAV